MSFKPAPSAPPPRTIAIGWEPVFGSPPVPLRPVTPMGVFTVRPAFHTPTPRSPVRHFDILPPLQSMRPIDKKPVFYATTPWPPRASFSPFDHTPPGRFDELPPMKSNEEQMKELEHFKSELAARTPSPALEAVHMGAILMQGIAVFVAALLTLIIVYGILKKNCTRGGVFAASGAVAAEQKAGSDGRPSRPEAPGPLGKNSPPPYYESTPSTNKYGGDEPPPYNPEDAALQEHKLQMDQCPTNVVNINGLDGFYIENVSTEMNPELVFDNGRIVQRLSLDMNNYDTGVVSNDR